MTTRYQAILAWLFLFAFLTLWVTERWALSVVQVGIYALALFWLVSFTRGKARFQFHPVAALLGVATAWGLLQILLGSTAYRWATENAALDWFTRLVVFLLVLQIYDSDVSRRRLLQVLLWFGFFAAVQASLQRFTAPDTILWLFPTDLKGVMGTFVYHNQYAAFIETILPLALVGAIEERQRSWLYGALAAVMLASVIAAESRAGASVLFVETFVVLLVYKRRTRIPGRRMWAVAAVTTVFVLGFTVAMGLGPLWEKLQRSDPWGERRLLTYSSIEMAMARPWAGFGLGTWSTAYPAFAKFDDGRFDNQAHNDWVQWAAEGGIPFFLLMLVIAGFLVRPAFRTVWGIGLLGVLVHCLVDYHFQQRPAFGYYYFALAAVAIRETDFLSRKIPGWFAVL